MEIRNILDSHAHYDAKQFNPDRSLLLQSLPKQGIIGVMNAASDLPSAQAGIQLAREYDYIYCAAGIHPHEAQDAPKDYLEQLRELLAQPKVLAVGEIGLDYHYDFSPRPVQLRVFEEQLALAAELELPVIVHDREAHADTMALLQKYRPKGVVHCFSGSAEMAREIVRLGMYIGFTGVITFQNAKKPLEALAEVPQDRLLIETDAPYMAPTPHRGKRCDSSLLPHVIERIAEVWNTSPQQVADQTAKNAACLFGMEVNVL